MRPTPGDTLRGILHRRLERLERRGQRRFLPSGVPAGCVDVAHNDYLGLIDKVSALKSDLPLASGGSRLLGAVHPVYRQLEAEFYHFKNGRVCGGEPPHPQSGGAPPHPPGQGGHLASSEDVREPDSTPRFCLPSPPQGHEDSLMSLAGDTEAQNLTPLSSYTPSSEELNAHLRRSTGTSESCGSTAMDNGGVAESRATKSGVLFFNSGFAANEAVIGCLNLPGTGFFYDELNHASIIDGIKLAKIPVHRKKAFRHQDLGELERLLRESKFELNVVVVESVYSMDGHVADVERIIALCRAYKGVVVVDEAHALGVYGPRGAGLCTDIDAPDIITINPCGKGMASHGAFLTGPKELIDYAITTARSFIYTTALPPHHCDILRQTLQVVAEADDRRKHLAQLVEKFHDRLSKAGVDTLGSSSHCVPIICGSNAKAEALAASLADAGFYAKPIRFPTVPKTQERVRISLNANLSMTDIDRLSAAIISFFDKITVG